MTAQAPNWCVDVLVLGETPEQVDPACRRALRFFEQPEACVPAFQAHTLEGLGSGAWLPSIKTYQPRFVQHADRRVTLTYYVGRLAPWIRGLAAEEPDVGWLVLMRQTPTLSPDTGQWAHVAAAHVHLPAALAYFEAHPRLTASELTCVLPTMFPVLNAWELLWDASRARDPLALELLSMTSVAEALLARARAQHLQRSWDEPVGQPCLHRL